MKRTLMFIACVAATEAFVPSSFSGNALAVSRAARGSSSMSSLTMVEENPALATFDSMEKEVGVPGGGFWFGSAGFWGEEDYRGFVDSYKPDNLINGVYPIIDRVRATEILTTTSESGLLSELEDAGLTLSEAEKLLPALEEGGLLVFVADNLDVLINLFGFLAIEPAKIAIPLVVNVVKALKGAGLLKLGSEGGVPVLATASASVSSAPLSFKSKASAGGRPTIAAAKSQVVAALKPEQKKVAAAAKSQVVAAKSQVVAALKPEPKKPKAAAAGRPTIAAAAKSQVVAALKPEPKKAPVKKLAAPKPSVSSPKGNISKIPKAL